MQDHGLFQAICRVNRLDDDSKDFGYIVDYTQLFGQLQTAMKDYTSGAFEGYDPEDVKGLVKDRHDATVSYFEEVYDAVEELCEGVEEPRGEIQYIHYFCGVSGQSEESDEIYARLREKLYRLVSSLVRAFAEAKPYLVDDISSGKPNEYDKKVTFYIELKKTIGTASGDFLDLKAYEPDMRKMIDNYITAADAEKIGDFDDLTLLDFVAKQGETLTGEGDSGHKEGAAEAIENNIRKKVIEKVTVNPRYYAKMSEILDKLIEERKQGVLSMSAKSTVKQRDAYVKEEYRKILKEEIEKRLPKWETQTGLKCDSWQTKYMVTKWGACSTDKKKLWFNLQLAQKPYACLDYIILHELTHLITRKHDATFIAHMDRHMPNWREIRKELNDSRLDYYEAQDESPLQKLIDQSRYDDIRDAAIAYIQEDHSGDTKRLSVIDMKIENVIHIEQPEDGVIAFDVIASCDVEMPSASRKGYFNERWLKIHCQVTLGIDMSGFRIMSVGNCEPQEESDNDRLSGELVPIISRDQFEGEAEKFLTRYCPEALDKPMRVPIETIASDMKLQVIEDVPLSDDLTYFGTIIFDNGNVLDKHRKITIRNAKRGTV